MYSIVCEPTDGDEEGPNRWTVDFSIEDGRLSALEKATLYAANVLLKSEAFEATLIGHGVAERYTKQHISQLLDAIEKRKLPLSTNAT